MSTNMENGNHVQINIDNPHTSLLDAMKDELENLSPLYSECCIFRVSERLRLVNEKAYTPRVVSIGPYHHGKSSLKGMETQKKRYLKDYIQRTNGSLETYLKLVRDKEAKLRSCYAETIKISSDEFVKIILVDSAFIIEVLLRYCFHEFRKDEDLIFNRPWMLQDVWPDLRLLENQLPFFILEELFDPNKITVSSESKEKLSLVKLSHEFFKSLMHLEKTEEYFTSSEVEHFVGLLRKMHMPLSPKIGGKLKTLSSPSMTELHRAGVKFKAGSKKNLFDVRFSNGVLEIPRFTISDETELTIRNILAFEQCHCVENYLNDYVVIMDRLVNTPKDVDLLVKYGIVENRLGDASEGATFINKLADGVIMESDNFYFASICEELNKYYKTSWHRWKANLRQNYFNTPWAIVSVIAAFFLLVLTFIQTVCSIFSAVKEKE